jgi:hypothetical protein
MAFTVALQDTLLYNMPLTPAALGATILLAALALFFGQESSIELEHLDSITGSHHLDCAIRGRYDSPKAISAM